MIVSPTATTDEPARRALVTGTAGFIGFHLARRLLEKGWVVAGIDAMTPYYDVRLKHSRHQMLSRYPLFSAYEIRLEDKDAVREAYAAAAPDVVVHLAAQAGVRYSLENPDSYVSSNVVGTFNLMECVRHQGAEHFLLASTSSVYGANEKMPFAETDRCDFPMTLYAATKKATEAMTHSYSHLWKIPTTVFRFFTVYGPWGRPDMALFKFANAMTTGEPIEIYGEGRMQRDFTYIDDLVEAIERLISVPPVEGEPVDETDSLSPAAPWRVVNIAGGRAVGLMDYVRALESEMGFEARKTMLPMQMGDVPATLAQPDLLKALTGYAPSTPVAEGVASFVRWFREYRTRQPTDS